MKTSIYIFSLLILFSCKTEPKIKNKLNVVCTTSQITDLVRQIGKDKIDLKGLMGPGVDPHLYKASEGDIHKFYAADLIFYNGLHLEGKLEDLLEKMSKQGSEAIAVTKDLNPSDLISSDDFASHFDPHVWFDINHWKSIAKLVSKTLEERDVMNAPFYKKNTEDYLNKLNALQLSISKTLNQLPEDQRILVTAHDAFAYLGKAYNFNVVSLQGLSTVAEAGVKDVQNLANFIINNKVKAIFVESSVPERTIKALQKAVTSKGHDVAIGGTLYSDALGDTNSPEGTYIGMYEYNMKTIISALK